MSELYDNINIIYSDITNNLAPNNLIKGIKIFNVVGTYGNPIELPSNVNFKYYSGKEFESYFYYIPNLQNMNEMFLESKFENIDLKTMDTTNVSDIGNCFGKCDMLQVVNLSYLNTSMVRNSRRGIL